MKDYLSNKIAYMLPKRIIYFVIIRAYAYVTSQVYPNLSPDEIGFSKLARSFEVKSNA